MLNDRIYEQLKPDQRLRAAVEAFARRDVTEIDRLHDTVEYVNARMQSPAYFERIRGLFMVAMMHGITARDAVLAFWAALWKFERTRPQESAVSALLHKGLGATDELSAQPAEEVPSTEEDMALDVMVSALATIKAHEIAWKTFCEDLAIDPEKVDFTYYKMCGNITDIFGEDLHELLEPDAETLQRELEFLRARWRHHLDIGRGFPS